MMYRLFLFFIVIVSSLRAHEGLVSLTHNNNELILTTLYGSTTITEPVLIALINNPFFERLKQVRQYGVMCYARPDPLFTRYEHSLGVFFITRLFGASLEEQIDALYHDISHTVFSHVGDVFFDSDFRTGLYSYQDGILGWFLEKTELKNVLEYYGFGHACSEEAKKNHRCFDQRLPYLGADRIEYNITGGYIDNLITRQEAVDLINDLRFINDTWFFVNKDSAKKFGLISLTLSETRWGACWSAFIDYCAAQALRRAYALNIITLDDIHFSVDEEIWQRLATTSDSEIQQWIDRITHCFDRYCVCEAHESTVHLKGKFSGTDPLVLTEQGLHHLTVLDEDYAREFARVKTLVTQGTHIKIK